MSIEILEGQGRVNDLGQLVLPLTDQKGRAVFFEEFFKTDIGKKLLPLLTEVVEQRIGEVAARWYGQDVELTIPQLTKVVESLLAVKDPSIIPATPEPAPVVERPRRADGTFASEFETFANEPHRSMAEIRARAGKDPAFREWFQKTSIEQTFQDGGLRVLGTPSRQPTKSDETLLGEFARLYRFTPSAKLKPLSGVITIDSDHRYTVTEFNQLVNRAASAGLL
jgi:hypothetical protein